MSRHTVIADARRDEAVGIWVISYYCTDCRHHHHYSAGPLTLRPPPDSTRRTACGRLVDMKVVTR